MSKIELSSEQKRAAFFPNGTHEENISRKRHLVIEAGAGAGKTRVLTERVHWLLCTSTKNFRLSPAELVLVTFSKAADEELRHRVEKEINSAQLGEEEKQRILSRLHISTIDSLFMQIVNNLFPPWWEQTKKMLSAETAKAWRLTDQRFPPPVTLVSDGELLPEISDELLRVLQEHSQDPASECATLDFILAGAFQSQGAFSTNKQVRPQLRGLERIAAAMLHESFLRENAPPLRFALERIHPSSHPLLTLIRSKARELFYRRLMHGRLTHNDRMLFLYHLLCIGDEQQKQGGLFTLAGRQPMPMRCKELIVDEYQDTNELQHEILYRLLEPNKGRMVVVGDPKQSIYGFRSAHVGVFQRLKADPLWQLVELTRNYRSHQDLLPFINLLSDMTFSYKNNRIPLEFHNTTFALTAQQTFVGSKSLDAGRSQAAAAQEEQLRQPRVLLLGASLNKQRSEDENFKAPTEPNTFALWALARELARLAGQPADAPLSHGEHRKESQAEEKTYQWSEMVVLCETNDLVAQTQLHLNSFGIPAVAKLSRPANSDSQRSQRSEELGLLLAKWLCRPLNIRELAEFLWSGWLGLTRDQASMILKSANTGQLDARVTTLPESAGEYSNHSREKPDFPGAWDGWIEHLLRCRTLASRHFFAAWQLLRWGFVCSEHNLAMENTAIALHNALEVWSLRQQLEQATDWPEEFLNQQLQQLRLAQSQTQTNQNAVTVCTVHGAKGLEWPVVVFWPNAARERTPENFVFKSHENATFVKWLAEDKESASLVRWIENPHTPTDRVSIQAESGRGEQIVRWSTDLQDRLEQDFERQRVFYTAFTRAREFLVLMSPAVQARTRSNLRDKLTPLKQGDTFDAEALKLNGLEYNVLALFADMAFDLRKEAKRGAPPPAPWHGLESEAACKSPDWQGLVIMRDYSPAWLPFVKVHEPAAEPSDTASAAQSEWIAEWLNAQHAAAINSPWKRPADAITLPAEPAGRDRTLEAEPSLAAPRVKTEGFSPAEEGLRFHAYMEHAEPRQLNKRGFLQKLLSAATVREHELEIWSSADVTQSEFNLKRGLAQTQRRIIDLFCVIHQKNISKDFFSSPCLIVNNRTGQSIAGSSAKTVKERLQVQLQSDPHLNLVIDFKTGVPAEEHIRQMGTYLEWIREILQTHPQLIVNDIRPTTLFADSVRPLMGMIYYTSLPEGVELHKFASGLVSVDKNASVLFISPD